MTVPRKNSSTESPENSTSHPCRKRAKILSRGSHKGTVLLTEFEPTQAQQLQGAYTSCAFAFHRLLLCSGFARSHACNCSLQARARLRR